MKMYSIATNSRKNSLRGRKGSTCKSEGIEFKYGQRMGDFSIPIIIVNDEDNNQQSLLTSNTTDVTTGEGRNFHYSIDCITPNVISSCAGPLSKSDAKANCNTDVCCLTDINSNQSTIETPECLEVRKPTRRRQVTSTSAASLKAHNSAERRKNSDRIRWLKFPWEEHSHASPGLTNLPQKEKMHDRLLRSTSHLDKINHHGQNGLQDARKLSLPHTLNHVGHFDKLPMKSAVSTDDEEGAHSSKHSFDDLWPEERPSSEFRLRDQLFSFFQASDNKLAMKLFGSRNALLREKRRQLVAKSWLIHPCSNFRLYWDLLMLIFLITNLVVLPVSIAFFYDDIGSHWIIFNITCDTMFIIDIIVNFRTGLIDPESHGDVILDSKVIALRYVKSWFVIDFISSLPLDYVFLSLEGQSYSAGRALRILRLAKLLQLLRLLRISRLVRYVRLWQEELLRKQMSKDSRSIGVLFFSLASIVVRIFNLICIMVLMGHWSGCIQFFVPVIQGWPEDSWISLNELQKAHWWEQYTRALFKALSHMLCIGYGQFPPRNMTDTWLTIASMLAGATCYALFIGHATTLIQSFDTSSRQFRDHLQQVNEYMIYRKLPTDLRRRITDFYEHRFGGKLFDEAAILAEISDSLRKDVIYHNCRELIMNVPFFVNADNSFVTDVITKLDFEMFQPGDIVIKADAKGDKMFFIQEGLVEILTAEGKIVTRLGDGSYFGEISLLSHQKRTATVRAATYCNLFSLSKEYFDKILECYPVMRRTLETIAAQRLHWLGKDPNMVTSRESLLDDINGIQRVFPDTGADSESDEELEVNREEIDNKDTNRQFLTVVKGFFTKDSDNFSPAGRALSTSGRINDVAISPVEKPIARCKSAINHLLMVPNMAASKATRRVQSTVCMCDFISHDNRVNDDHLHTTDRTPLMRSTRHHSAYQLSPRKSPSPDLANRRRKRFNTSNSDPEDTPQTRHLLKPQVSIDQNSPVKVKVTNEDSDSDFEQEKPVKFVLPD